MISFKNWIYYIFPKRCAVCARVIPYKEMLCVSCALKIKPISEQRCLKCGQIKKRCECNKYAYHFRGIVSPFENKDAAQNAVYGYKFIKNIDAADFLSAKMAKAVVENFENINFDCVTSVPMHYFKKYLTGFDHTGILAKRTANELNLPYKKLLTKAHKNQTQHSLGAKERFKNVKNVYVAKQNNFNNVLLVDDIKTTGATLDECARKLMLSGTQNVYCVTAVIGTCKTDKG